MQKYYIELYDSLTFHIISSSLDKDELVKLRNTHEIYGPFNSKKDAIDYIVELKVKLEDKHEN